MRFFDSIALGQAVEVEKARKTRGGALVVDARAARGGNVQDYLGAEVGKPDMPIVRVYRDADQVFSKDSISTIAHKTVTVGHPASGVTSINWKDVAVGHSGDAVMRDGEFVRIPMMIADESAIRQVEAGTRELSLGYTCDLKFEAGTSPSGAAYDAKQVNILVDHIAIVPQGRAGPDCRIGDGRTADDWKTMRALDTSQPQPKDIPPMATRSLMLDGIPVTLDDVAAAAVTKMQSANAQLTADNLRLTADANAAKAAHDKAMGEKDSAIKTLTDAKIDDAKLYAMAADLAGTITSARGLVADVKVDGLGAAAIRRATLCKLMGDAAMTGKSDDYVHAMFDHRVAEAGKTNHLADALGAPLTLGDAESRATAAREKATRDMSNAWKGQPKAA